METYEQEKNGLKKDALVFGSFSLSLFWVIALWNFWSRFVDALGFNMTAFILGVLVLFFAVTGFKSIKSNYSWAIPIMLIATSFSLWDNPYLKVVSLFFLPVICSIFFAYAFFPKNKLSIQRIVFSFLFERITLLIKLNEAVRLIFEKLRIGKGEKSKLIMRIILGFFLFIILAFTIFLPLLSAADPVFKIMVQATMDWFYDIISWRYFMRIVLASLSTIFLISYFLSLEKAKGKPSLIQNKSENKPIDPIVSGIILGGVMLLYVIFLWTQLSHLWINQLPVEFRETERLVKSGFWQLFTLSLINIAFFFGYFRKTNLFVQNILKAFTIASFLLLLSAGQRMFLYVLYYGLSYEKFFASYVVVYCALLFVWLAYQLFFNRTGNILKFVIFSLLWMYAVLTVMPVERIIFSFNANLATRDDSRIKLNELRMLSYDAFPLIVDYRKDEVWEKDWCYWSQSKLRTLERKEWYEKNLSNIIPVNAFDSWKNGECAKLFNEDTTKVRMPETVIEDTRKTYRNEEFSFEVKYPDAGWKIINYFDTKTGTYSGGNIFKDPETNVAVLPLGSKNISDYPETKVVVSQIKIGEIFAQKKVWQLPEGKFFSTVNLSSYPSFWNEKQVIEIKYKKETEKEVNDIVTSLRFYK